MDYYDDDPQPWWRRGWVVITAVAAVLVVIGLFVVAPWAGDEPDGRATTSPRDGGEESGETEESSSTCGLPDGDQTVPETAPSVDWRSIDQVTTPVSSSEYGPADDVDGIYTCFARNPSGAVLAAAADFAQGGSASVDAVAYVEERYARGDYYEQKLKDARDSGQSTRVAGEVVGFRVFNYTRDEVQLELVGRFTESQYKGTLIAASYELRWVNGDWRLVAPKDVDKTVTSPTSLSAYVTWTPPRVPAAAPGTDGLSRVAPVWAMAAAPASEEDEGFCVDKLSLDCGKDLARLAGAAPDIAAGTASAVPGAAVSAAASSAFEKIAQDMVDAQEWALEKLLTAWLSYPDPDLQGSDSTMVWLQDQLQLFVVFVAVGSILVAAYRLATTGRFEHLSDLGGLLTRVILTGGLVGFLVTLCLEIGDLFSEWILAQVEFDLSGAFQFDPSAPTWILLIGGAIVVLVQFFQFAIMIFRYAAVLYLCAGLTLFAAASNTRVGKQGWEKSVAWLTAFVFYKPVAALIYALAIKLTSGDSVADQVAGIAAMILALFALPAMMRLIAPATATLGGANAGALAGATVGATVATGAVLATAGGAGAAGGAVGGGFAGAASSGGGRSMATMTGGSGGSSGPGGGGSTPPSGSPPPAPEAGGADRPISGTTGSPDSAGRGEDGSPGLGSAVDEGRSTSGAPPASGAPSSSGADAASVLRGLGTGSSAGGRVARGVEDTTGGEEEER